jgi:hypothetical protein
VIREYNSELYILPEIVKVVDSRWLLVRKLELQKMSKEILPGNFSIRDSILEKIKKADSLGGLDKEQIILELNVSVDVANLEIKKLLEEGMIYEPRPGVLRYLG